VPKINPTINEIARLAGVSKKTISRVINDEQGVSEDTRSRIKRIMEEVGYEPSRRARALANSRSFLLGLVYNNANSSYVLDLLAGCQATGNAQGYEIVMHSISEEDNAAQEIIRFMRRSGCDGLILTPPVSESTSVLAALLGHQWPMVRIAGDNADFQLSQIKYNDRTASLTLASELIRLGHRQIAFIGGPNQAGPTLRRLAGVHDALALHGLALGHQSIRYGDFTFESGREMAMELLTQPNRPTAIICANDEMAAGSYQSAATLGIAIPTELSVSGFDDSPVASHLWPQLTTVRQPVQDMAAEAVLQLINFDHLKSNLIIKQYEADVVFRNSMAPPPEI